jgi:23S rRNA (pseudouridine1915-N3)-methyltransferase
VRFVVAAVGKPRDRMLAAAIHEYETRARRYWPLDVREVREEPARAASADLVREREGERLLAQLSAGAVVVACDAGGVAMTSEEFSAWLQQLRERAEADLVFVIGGAFGLSPKVRDRANRTLSFGRWTMAHELARLVLAEQLYRAGTIIRREPYHK